jgi:hypothetical protein
MPTRILRGDELANAIYEVTDALEAQFAAEFLRQMRKFSKNKGLQAVLADIEAGTVIGMSSIPARLGSLSISTSKLDAIVRKAMGSAARITNEKVGINAAFDVFNPEVLRTAQTMSVTLSTNLNATAQQVLDKIISDAVSGTITRREAVMRIQSRVGLLPAHADAVDRYYDTLIQTGTKQKVAKRMADEYAERLLRYRANTIARTEIARAAGVGQTEYWRQAVADGALPLDVRRVWMTAYDERVCEICGPMNNTEVGVMERWLTPNGLVDYPSAIHPNCRCTQGIALSASQRRMFIGKSDMDILDLLAKANPYHDERGRFTSANRAVAPFTRKRTRSIKPNVKRSRSILAPSSPERAAEIERLAENGSSQLLGGRDPRTGIVRPLQKFAAVRRYGNTPESVGGYLKKEVGVNVEVRDPHWSTKEGIAQLHGVAQALEEAHRMGISFEGVVLRLRGKATKDDGAYDSVEGVPKSGVITIWGRRAEDLYRIVQAQGEKPPEFASSYGTLGVEQAKRADRRAQDALIRKWGYAIAIHEIGHHYTVHRGKFLKMRFERLKRLAPVSYARSDYYETAAEAFTAWWLLSGSKVPLTQRYLADWRIHVRAVLNIGDYAIRGLYPERLLKALERIARGRLKLEDLPPDHPLIVYLTDGQSLTDTISKANPYHDEKGRFTSAGRAVAPQGRRRLKLRRAPARPSKQPSKVGRYSDEFPASLGARLEAAEKAMGKSIIATATAARGINRPSTVKQMIGRATEHLLSEQRKRATEKLFMKDALLERAMLKDPDAVLKHSVVEQLAVDIGSLGVTEEQARDAISQIRMALYNRRDIIAPTPSALVPEGHKYRYELANMIVHQWAISSNDHHPVSLAIQEIAQDLFGLRQAVGIGTVLRSESGEHDLDRNTVDNTRRLLGLWSYGGVRSLKPSQVPYESGHKGPFVEAVQKILMAQYIRTQQVFRALGQERISATRGIRLDGVVSGRLLDHALKDIVDSPDEAFAKAYIAIEVERVRQRSAPNTASYESATRSAQKSFEADIAMVRAAALGEKPMTRSVALAVEKLVVGRVYPLTIGMRPLSSWSWSAGEATRFGNHAVNSSIPVSRILSCPLTGNGCNIEEELVVLGGRMEGAIALTRDLSKGAFSRREWHEKHFASSTGRRVSLRGRKRK